MSALQIKKAYVDTPYGQIHYRYTVPSKASKATPLIFLHKSASSSVSMEKLMSHYTSQGHTCYAPDMPGFGSSFDPSPSAITLIESEGTAWYCKLYVRVFTDLGIWREDVGVHLLGHHSGASLSPQLASLYPKIVRSVCLVGASIMSAAERAEMKEKFMVPFNQPVVDGSHLQKTWDYLGRMGVTSKGGDLASRPKECSEEDLELWQRELVDHVRAWRGRMQIYGAVWSRDSEGIFLSVKCPILVLCARDDVLYSHLGNAKRLRPDDENVVVSEIGGANFTVDRDVEGLVKIWTPFMKKARA